MLNQSQLLNYKNQFKILSWDFYSKLLIASYCTFQITRWPILPQFMDIYYHLLTAWGFLQAGGYSGWDFWQYAPVGRIHIYPPVFHIILALLIRSGISKVILAKFFEAVTPAVFLIVLWRFIRKNYNERLAFFVTLAFGSSLSFYLSLLNHVPATIAFILGFLAFEQMFQKKILRSLILLSLCFYTHIGISWFFLFSFIFYGLSNKEYKNPSFFIALSTFILSSPILFKQLTGLKFISSLGFALSERYVCQFKIIDYVLAFFGLILSSKMNGKYRLFLSLFLASFIFLIYPYRFFSAEGYLPIIFLSALALYHLYEKLKNKTYIKYFYFLTIIFIILFLSPTVSMDRRKGEDKLIFKLRFCDSAFIGMLFARGGTIWFPQEYLSAAALIKKNSEDNDIVYSSLDISGMTLASISGRATANALFPEIGPLRRFNPIKAAKIIVFVKDDKVDLLNRIVDNYKLIKIGENKIFILYKNLSCNTKIDLKRASLPFWAILSIGFIFMVLFFMDKQKFI